VRRPKETKLIHYKMKNKKNWMRMRNEEEEKKKGKTIVRES
jgi:hypothetical protein